MKQLPRTLIFATTIATSSCVSTSLNSNSARFDIAETIVRQLVLDTSRPGRPIAICFPKLSDPSPRFLNRLTEWRVYPCSALIESRPGTISTIAITGEWATTYFIQKISIDRAGRASVVASHWREALDGGGYTFVLQLINGKWVVIDTREDWIG